MINQKRKTAKSNELLLGTGQIMQDTTLSNAQKQQYGQTTTWSINKPTISLKRKIKVILFTGKKGQTYFRILGGNNKTIACSEGYLSIKNAMKTIKLIEGLNIFDIKDLTK